MSEGYSCISVLSISFFNSCSEKEYSSIDKSFFMYSATINFSKISRKVPILGTNRKFLLKKLCVLLIFLCNI